MNKEMLRAIDEIDHRLEECSRSFHNSQVWGDEEMDDSGKTYGQWLNEAFEAARNLARKMK